MVVLLATEHSPLATVVCHSTFAIWMTKYRLIWLKLVEARNRRTTRVSCSATLNLKRFGLAAALACSMAGALHAATPAPQKLAIVNVSYIFENFKKVSDLQRTIDEKFKLDEGKLQLKFKDLSQRNKELDPYLNKGDLDNVDPVIF